MILRWLTRSSAFRRPGVRSAWPLLVVLVSLALAWPPTGSRIARAASAYPMQLTDDLGRSVVLPAAPRRVVSLVPSISETVCAIGACHVLVGVDDYSDHPAQLAQLPRLGGVYDPRIEATVALEPDLVLASRYGNAYEMLRQAGVPVLVLQVESYDDVFRVMGLLGQALDRRHEARALAERIRDEASRIEEAARSAGGMPSVYYEIDETPYSVGPGSFIGTLLTRAGGRNIVPDGLGLFPRISPELVIAADPDVIILGDGPYGTSVASLRQRPGWAGLRALESGRVVALTQAQVDILSRPGPRVTEALRMLALILHPELAGRLQQP